MQTTNRDLISSAEAASRLKVDRSTFHRWVRNGRIKAQIEVDGIRGAKFFDPKDIDALATALAGNGKAAS